MQWQTMKGPDLDEVEDQGEAAGVMKCENPPSDSEVHVGLEKYDDHLMPPPDNE